MKTRAGCCDQRISHKKHIKVQHTTHSFLLFSISLLYLSSIFVPFTSLCPSSKQRYNILFYLFPLSFRYLWSSFLLYLSFFLLQFSLSVIYYIYSIFCLSPFYLHEKHTLKGTTFHFFLFSIFTLSFLYLCPSFLLFVPSFLSFVYIFILQNFT